MPDMPVVQEKLLEIVDGLVRFRFVLSGVTLDLEGSTDQADGATDAETELRSNLECALVDHFDPMLRTLLNTAGGHPRAKLLEAAVDLAGVRHRLKVIAENLPRSPQEDAMLDGDIPADEPTEMRTTINAILGDQLDLAIDNLLHAAGYQYPEPPSEQSATPRAVLASDLVVPARLHGG